MLPGAGEELRREDNCLEAAVSMGGLARMLDSKEGFLSRLMSSLGGTASISPASRLAVSVSSLMGRGVRGSMACIEDSERLRSDGDPGGDGSCGDREVMLSTPESDSLSIRSETPDPDLSSSSCLGGSARPDLSWCDRSERKGL